MTTALPTRTLGSQDPETSTIGFGCVGMSAMYGVPASERDVMGVIHRTRGATVAARVFWTRTHRGTFLGMGYGKDSFL